MRFAVALLLALHGLAHVVGFLGAWRPRSLNHTTRVLAGHFDVGEAGIRAVGVGWLVLAFAFAVAAVAAVTRAPWFVPYTLGVAAASLAYCVVGWPQAKIGLALNAAVLALLGAAVLWDRVL